MAQTVLAWLRQRTKVCLRHPFPNFISVDAISFRVRITSYNVCYTKLLRYTGYDPEASTIDPYNPTVEGVGRDYCAYPKARTYTASISVQF